MNLLIIISLFVCLCVNVWGFLLSDTNEVKVSEITIKNPETPEKSQKFFGDVEKLLQPIIETLKLKIEERIPQSKRNSTLCKLLESLSSSNGSRKVRSVINPPPIPPQPRSNDWPEFTSRAEFEEFKIMEGQHLNSLRTEIQKLDQLLHLLQDQQKVLTTLDGFGSKPKEAAEEKEYLKLLKMAYSMRCDKDQAAPSIGAQDKELLTSLSNEIGELKHLLNAQNIQEKTNEKYLYESLEAQKHQLQRLQGIVESFPTYLKTPKAAEEPNRIASELSQNTEPWRSPPQNPETQPWNEVKPPPPPPPSQASMEIVGSPQRLLPIHDKLLTKTWNPKARSSADFDDYSQLLRLLNERRPKPKEVKPLREQPIPKKPMPVKQTPKLRAPEDDLMDNLEKLLDQQPKAKESLNSHADIEKRLLELQRQLEFSEQFSKIESKIDHLSTAESKSLDSTDDELKEEIRKLNVQLKKLNKSPIESKSLDDGDLKRELKNLQLKNEIQHLQTAIDGLRPQEQEFSFQTQSKSGPLEFQSMLSQLIDLNGDGGSGFQQHGGHLNEAQIHYIKQKMAAYGGRGKYTHGQSGGGYGIGNSPFGNGVEGSRYDSLYGPASGHGGGGSRYDALYGLASGNGGGGSLYSLASGNGGGGNKYDALYGSASGNGGGGNKYDALYGSASGNGGGGNKYDALYSSVSGNGGGGNKYDPLYGSTSGNGGGENRYDALYSSVTGNGGGGNRYDALYGSASGNEAGGNRYDALYGSTSGNGGGGGRYDALPLHGSGSTNGYGGVEDSSYGLGRGLPYSSFNSPYGSSIGKNDFYSNQNNLPNLGGYSRPNPSSNGQYGGLKKQYVPHNPSNWAPYAQKQPSPTNYPVSNKPQLPQLNYDANRNSDYFRGGQYGTIGAQPNNGDAQNYFSTNKPYDVPNSAPPVPYNNVIPPQYPSSPKPEPLPPAIPSGPPQNFYGPPNQQPSQYQAPPQASSLDVHNIFEQLAYAGGGSGGPNFQNVPDPAGYKSSTNVDTPNSAQPYSNPPENPQPGNEYSQQQVGDLKGQIYNLQNVINNLNQPDYAQSPGDRETVYKLDKRITDLKNVINQISVDPNAAQYENLNPPPVEQQQNYQAPEAPPVQLSDKPGEPNYAPPSQSRMVRSLFAPLTDFGKLHDAIKAAALELAKNQSLPALEDNARDTPRTKRQTRKSEEEKLMAMREFLLQVEEMASAVNYLYDGLFPSKNETQLKRDSRENNYNKAIDINRRLEKVIEMVENLEKTVEVQGNKCRCAAARKKRAYGKSDATQQVMENLASFLTQIVDDELKSEAPVKKDGLSSPKSLHDKLRDLASGGGERKNAMPFHRNYNPPKTQNFLNHGAGKDAAFHSEDPKLLQDKIRELKEQLAQKMRFHQSERHRGHLDQTGPPREIAPQHRESFPQNFYRTVDLNPAYKFSPQSMDNQRRTSEPLSTPDVFSMENQNQRVFAKNLNDLPLQPMENKKFDNSVENQRMVAQHAYAPVPGGVPSKPIFEGDFHGFSPKMEEYETEQTQRSKFDNQYPGYPSYENYSPQQVVISKEVKKDSLLEKIIAKVITKIFQVVSDQLPSLLQKLLGFGLGSFLNFNDYGYNDQSVDYDSSGYPVVKPKGLGLLGLAPMLILKLISSLTSFLQQLQKNKFVRNFFVPVVIAGLCGGLVLFLVWWFTSSEQYGDNYSNNIYAENENYYKSSQDYGNYRSNEIKSDDSKQSYDNPYLYLNRSSYPSFNSFNSNYFKYN